MSKAKEINDSTNLLTNSQDPAIVEKNQDIEKQEEKNKPTNYAYIILALVLFIYICN